MLDLKLLRQAAVTAGLIISSCALAPIGAAQQPTTKARTQVGDASWYGVHHQGRPTASGEAYDPRSLTAAHPSLPLDSTVRVTNLKNGKSVVVRINDRRSASGQRIISVSRQAAEALGFVSAGSAQVRLDVIH